MVGPRITNFSNGDTSNNINNNNQSSSSSNNYTGGINLQNQHSSDETPMALLEQLVYVDNFLQNNDPTNETNFDEQLSAELAAFADDTFIFPDEEKPKVKTGDSSSINMAEGLVPGQQQQQLQSQVSNTMAFNHISPVPASNAMNQTNTNRGIPSTIHELLGNISLPQTSQISHIPSTTFHDVNVQSSLTPQPQLLPAQQQQPSASLPSVSVPQGALSTLAAAGLSQTQIQALATLMAYHKDTLETQQLAPQQPSTITTTTSSSFSPQPQPQIPLPATRTSNVSLPSLTRRPTTPSVSSSSAQASSFEPSSHYSTSSSTISPQHNILSQQSPTNPSVSHSPVAHITTPTNGTTPTITATPLPNLSVNNNSSNSNNNTTASILKIMAAHNSTTSDSPPQTGVVQVDKRRRNTAASARFRIKKKLKEQEMERALKDLSDLSRSLELKIQQLEMENRLLRNLVVEKGNQRDTEELERLRKRAKISVDQKDEGGDN